VDFYLGSGELGRHSDVAVNTKQCGGVGDGGYFDFAAHFQVKAADLRIAFPVGEG
jgi:hypothetical protein